MNDTTQAPIERVQKIDKLGRAYGTGRRKTSVARVWIKSGTGKFIINRLDLSEYIQYHNLQIDVCQPFHVTSTVGKFDVFATVKGGGTTGQAGAIRLGISRALQEFNPLFRPALKTNSLLTRDSREVERKKYGMRKARRKFQFSKR